MGIIALFLALGLATKYSYSKIFPNTTTCNDKYVNFHNNFVAVAITVLTTLSRNQNQHLPEPPLTQPHHHNYIPNVLLANSAFVSGQSRQPETVTLINRTHRIISSYKRRRMWSENLIHMKFFEPYLPEMFSKSMQNNSKHETTLN